MMRQICLAFLAFFLVVCPVRAGEALRIGTPALLAGGRGAETQAVLREAYRQLGLEVTFVDLPTLRELEWADLGEIDGCLARTTSVADGYPNLVRVRFPLFRHCLTACSLAEGVEIQGPNDLQGLRVGVGRGTLGSIGYLQRHGIEPVQFNDLDAALAALGEGRIDAVVGERVLMKMAARAQAIPVRYSRPLRGWNFYHWVYREHADLALRLAEVLRTMYEEGVTARLLGDYAWLLDGLDPGDEARAPIRPVAGAPGG
jgi:ABC-type nitrate/sulfonate/bicarbonate transport system substrate-binding protein